MLLPRDPMVLYSQPQPQPRTTTVAGASTDYTTKRVWILHTTATIVYEHHEMSPAESHLLDILGTPQSG